MTDITILCDPRIQLRERVGDRMDFSVLLHRTVRVGALGKIVFASGRVPLLTPSSLSPSPSGSSCGSHKTMSR